MAAGELSPDQGRYVDLMAAGTGLARLVLVAWVGSESAWGTTKPSHNYLNVGPGRNYPTTEAAAAAAASLIESSARYAGIRAAVPIGPNAQIKAIAESPWGTNPALLARVYLQLAGGATAPAAGASVQEVGFWQDQWQGFLGSFGLGVPPENIPVIGGAVAGAADALGGAVAGGVNSVIGSVVKAGVDLFLAGAMGIVFAAAALGLIALGLNRLTGTSAKERIGQAAQLASVAAVA